MLKSKRFWAFVLLSTIVASIIVGCSPSRQQVNSSDPGQQLPSHVELIAETPEGVKIYVFQDNNVRHYIAVSPISGGTNGVRAISIK